MKVSTKWLVTGTTGFIGAPLAASLAQHDPVCGTFHTVPYEAPSWHSQERLNIAHKDEVASVIARVRPDCVVHLAGVKDVRWCEEHPDLAYAINAEGTRHVAEACHDHRIFLVFVSSDYVFDGKDGHYDPASPCRPETVYGQSKRAGEEAIAGLGLPAAIVRSGGVYAADNPEQNFLGYVMKKLRNREAIAAYDNIFNTPTLVWDLVSAIRRIGAERIPGCFHLAGPDRESRYSFARAFARDFGFPVDLIRAERCTPKAGETSRPVDVSLDSRSSMQQLGLEFHGPSTGFRAALSATAAR